MKKILLLVFLASFFYGNSQNTAIPDPNFEQALINLGYDTGVPDGSVPTANISGVTNLYVSFKNISDLTGIEDFVSLTSLICYNNQLSSLDLTQNTSLTILYCYYNQLSSLDLSQNTSLAYLSCNNNQLTSLDLSQNTSLNTLSCGNNQLTSLDLSQNTSLAYLYCNNNQLNSLDLTQNTSLLNLFCINNQLSSLDLSYNTVLDSIFCSNNQLTCLNVKNGNNHNIPPYGFEAQNNPDLYCIEVDDTTYSSNTWSNIDSQTSFSNNCNNSCTVGLGEHELNEELVLYPNPTTGFFTINTYDLNPATVVIYNSVGQQVWNKSYPATTSIPIDLDAPSGIYFLKVETGGNIITKKLIIH